MSRFGAVLAFVSLASLAAACGTTPPATTPPEGTASPDASGAPAASGAPMAAPAVWKDDLSNQEKAAFMKAHVMAPLTAAFQASDPKLYATVGCTTCHGPKLEETKVALPHLTMKDGKLTCFAEKPEVSKYMHEKIVPAMAKALGKPEYDMTTKQGFGCMGCHAVDMK
jgi:cytochrome c551/c552